MPGTIFNLPDDMHLQRGITYTILPDGRSARVPAMSRLQVRAESQSHREDGDEDAMQALKDILMGKKWTKGRARHDRSGRARGNKVDFGRSDKSIRGNRARYSPIEGLRPAGDMDAGKGHISAQ